MKMSLTDEQIKSIEVYWRKWEALVMFTKPVNQEQMTKAIKQLYKHSNLDPPEILYVASPDRYYAQAFLVSMPDWLQEQMGDILRSDSNNIFLDEYQNNVEGKLTNRLSSLPIDNLRNNWLKLTLEKIRSGNKHLEARQEAFAEIYSPEAEASVKLVREVDRKLTEISQFSDYSRGFYTDFLETNPCSSWMVYLLNSLNSKLNIPVELIIEAVDVGYRMDDFAGRCLHRVWLAFTCARLEYFKEVLGFEGILTDELARSLMRFGGCMLFPYERVCIVCDSPRIISFNSSKSSDAKRNAYVKFSDGFTVSKNY